jgi:hypothetical protein
MYTARYLENTVSYLALHQYLLLQTSSRRVYNHTITPPNRLFHRNKGLTTVQAGLVRTAFVILLPGVKPGIRVSLLLNVNTNSISH